MATKNILSLLVTNNKKMILERQEFFSKLGQTKNDFLKDLKLDVSNRFRVSYSVAIATEDEELYFRYKKPVLLLVDKKKSYDKSFKGDFNFISNQLIKREKNNNYIFTGAQIITRSVFSGVQKNIFSMNMIWDQLIQKQMLLGQESNQTFFHINNLKVFKELEKLKFID